MDTQLLKTKLYVPPPRPDLVARPRLIERLDEGLHLGHGLTLVAAPAGYGKTTLLATWIASLDRSVAWLSLDGGDDDPVRFWSYVLAALQTVPPLGERGVVETLLAALQSPQPPPFESVLAALVNEIVASPDPLLLVLDDYHLIDSQSIHAGVAFLLEHQPAHMHVAITTRKDPMLPLARLRVRRQLTEIRAADLRFLPQEATAFYNEIANLGLTPEQVAILETRTEGWIAGLQMALFSLEGKVDRSAFITAFAGDDRQVMDYLAHLGELARTEGIHLAAAYVVPVQTEPLLLANKIAWLRPDGSVDHEYEKNVPAPAVEPVRKGALPPQAIAAENGLIMSAAICYDYDFPRIANQIGRLGAGLVLLPSGARRGIDPMHTQISAFRAVENGHAIVRATNNGLSGAVSPVGRLLGWRIAGQVAVVTGAGWGTGFEAARALAWLGAHVCIAEVDRRTGHQAAGRIAAEFGEGAVSFLRTDVGNERSVARLARRSLWSVSQDNGSINQRKKENRI